MKKIIWLFVLVFGLQGFAQKFCYVDSKYIMEEIPEYGVAMQQIDELSSKWQKEIEAAKKEINNLWQYYKAEEPLLSPAMKTSREDEIIRKEKELKKLKQHYFGSEGLLYKKQVSLLKPIQDQVYNAISEFATQYKFAVVFDKAGELVMLFTDPKYDKSDDILRKLGY